MVHVLHTLLDFVVAPDRQDKTHVQLELFGSQNT